MSKVGKATAGPVRTETTDAAASVSAEKVFSDPSIQRSAKSWEHF